MKVELALSEAQSYKFFPCRKSNIFYPVCQHGSFGESPESVASN